MDETLKSFVESEEEKPSVELEQSEQPYKLSDKQKSQVLTELKARGLSDKESSKALSTIVKIVEG